MYGNPNSETRCTIRLLTVSLEHCLEEGIHVQSSGSRKMRPGRPPGTRLPRETSAEEALSPPGATSTTWNKDQWIIVEKH